MANERNRKDPTTPSQVSGGINPSSPTQGTEGPSTNLSSTQTGDNASMRQSRSVSAGDVGSGNLSFRCADAGQAECDWQTTGRNEDEIRERVGQHAREHHGFKEWTDENWNRVRNAIRRAAA